MTNSVTAEQALWKADVEAANTIWGTVNHLIFCETWLLNDLHGRHTDYPASNDATFEPDGQTDEQWQQAVDRLFALHSEIRSTISVMNDAEHDGTVADKPPLAEQILNHLLHIAYHTGHIIFIRKQQGSWPSSRSFG